MHHSPRITRWVQKAAYPRPAGRSVKLHRVGPGGLPETGRKRSEGRPDAIAFAAIPAAHLFGAKYTSGTLAVEIAAVGGGIWRLGADRLV